MVSVWVWGGFEEEGGEWGGNVRHSIDWVNLTGISVANSMGFKREVLRRIVDETHPATAFDCAEGVAG